MRTQSVTGSGCGRVRSVGPVGLVGELAGALGHVDSARGASRAPELVSEPDLRVGLEQVDALRAGVDILTVRLVAEAMGRGLPAQEGMGVHDWLLIRCPWLSKAHATAVVSLAKGWEEPAHAPIRQAIDTGALSIHRAATITRALRQVRPAVDDDTYAEDVRILLGVGLSAKFTDRELKRVTDHLIAAAVPERDQAARDKAIHDLRGVNESSLADGSLTRFILTCEPEGAARIRAILGSPLAAPSSTEGPDGPSLDLRSIAQRNYDALMTVLARGVAGTEGMPTTPKAQLIITLDYNTLARQLAGTPATSCADDGTGRRADAGPLAGLSAGLVPHSLAGAGRGGGPVGPGQSGALGAGSTVLGQVLSPGIIRRLACDADLIPMVLGTEGEILDQGRRRRLVTAGQRRALAIRDKGCSFPGCTVPPTWTDAHHVQHWARGGRSDLDNYALLCPRHHTHVHDHELTATVTAFGVTWHLR